MFFWTPKSECVFVHICCAPVGLVFLERRFDVRWAGGVDWGGMRKWSDAQEKYSQRKKRRGWGLKEIRDVTRRRLGMGHSAAVLTVIAHSSLKFMTAQKQGSDYREGLLFAHRPSWSWLCCLYCSSILWGLEELYTPPPPYKAASDTTTSGLQWRLEEESRAHIKTQ